MSRKHQENVLVKWKPRGHGYTYLCWLLLHFLVPFFRVLNCSILGMALSAGGESFTAVAVCYEAVLFRKLGGGGDLSEVFVSDVTLYAA